MSKSSLPQTSTRPQDLIALRREALKLAILKRLVCNCGGARCGCRPFFLTREAVQSYRCRFGGTSRWVEQQFEELWRDGLVEINLDLQVQLTRKGEEVCPPCGRTLQPGDARPANYLPREGRA